MLLLVEQRIKGLQQQILIILFLSAPGKPKAGKYGDYLCDIPLRTLESMLQHISTTHKVGADSSSYLRMCHC